MVVVVVVAAGGSGVEALKVAAAGGSGVEALKLAAVGFNFAQSGRYCGNDESHLLPHYEAVRRRLKIPFI